MILSFRKIKSSLRSVRRVLRGYRNRIFLIIILGFLAGFSGSIGIGAVIPLFSLLTDTQGVVPDSITSAMIRVFNLLHIPFTLPFVGALIAGLFVFKALVQYAAKYINHKTGAEYEEKMRASLIRK